MSDTIIQQRVIVTAGGSGIGRAIVDQFVASGARVHICDVRPDFISDLTASNTNVTGTLADVSKPADVENLVAEAVAQMGGLDVLVNNAGIGGPRGAIEDISYEDWDRTISVNLNGMFYCIKNVAPHMKAQKSGSIVNISTASAKVALPMRSPYVASKVGVLGLTHTVAREYGPFGIRCNSILPGLIDNERGRGIIANQASERGITPEEREAEFLEFISLKCWIDPSEVGDLAVFLASHAGRHITGQDIGMDGNVEWEI
ncbi:MAG: SDR family oxidoreductase [Alphaproteobacteria bacterium]|jgi:NAD(P)-dependent dehydrogenase (short-subunit alcohol dehydrogenase family)|nr:SDR family oxidoreductase [Alphaproteobacteria bacterium]